jgi:hypothetical protein
MSEGAIIQKKNHLYGHHKPIQLKVFSFFKVWNFLGLLEWEIDLLRGLYLAEQNEHTHTQKMWTSMLWAGFQPKIRVFRQKTYTLLTMWKQWSVINDQNKYLDNQCMGWYFSTLNPWACFLLALSVKLCYRIQHKICSYESPMPFRFTQHCAEKNCTLSLEI